MKVYTIILTKNNIPMSVEISWTRDVAKEILDKFKLRTSALLAAEGYEFADNSTEDTMELVLLASDNWEPAAYKASIVEAQLSEPYTVEAGQRASDLLSFCRNSLMRLTESSYIPFDSPSPSSTEALVKKGTKYAIENLNLAIDANELLFRR